MPAALALLALTSWRTPWNRVWTNPSGEYVLSVAVEAKKVGLRLYTLGAGGKELTMWRSTVDFYPAQVMISDDGHVVALNEYPGYGHRTGVAVFGDDGRTLGRYSVDALIPKDEFEKLPGNEGLRPKQWVQWSIFDSVKNLVNPPPVKPQPEERKVGEATIRNGLPYAFKLQTTTGRAFWFDLTDGRLIPAG